MKNLPANRPRHAVGRDDAAQRHIELRERPKRRHTRNFKRQPSQYLKVDLTRSDETVDRAPDEQRDPQRRVRRRNGQRRREKERKRLKAEQQKELYEPRLSDFEQRKSFFHRFAPPFSSSGNCVL